MGPQQASTVIKSIPECCKYTFADWTSIKLILNTTSLGSLHLSCYNLAHELQVYWLYVEHFKSVMLYVLFRNLEPLLILNPFQERDEKMKSNPDLYYSCATVSLITSQFWFILLCSNLVWDFLITSQKHYSKSGFSRLTCYLWEVWLWLQLIASFLNKLGSAIWI